VLSPTIATIWLLQDNLNGKGSEPFGTRPRKASAYHNLHIFSATHGIDMDKNFGRIREWVEKANVTALGRL
jgi:hypothetical protein